MERISILINEVCHNLGIDYKSKYLDEARKNNVINKISNVYMTLSEVIADLSEIEDAYQNNKELVELFEKIIRELETIDHDLIIEAVKLSKKK